MLNVYEKISTLTLQNMKIYINKARESWVVDRFRSEWLKHSKNKTRFLKQADVVWIIAPWTWQNLNTSVLKNKKIVCTIHHIDLDKFDKKQKEEFYIRDKFIDEYHVPSNSSYKQLRKLTDKKINAIPFWIDNEKYFHINNKKEIRNRYSIPEDKFVVGSFQRDTEGSDLVSPKLSKGPDILIKYLKEMNVDNENLFILLSGYRRQYIINELNRLNIDYKFIERPSFKVLNELYNTLDLYIVASRVEGGPQSIMECGLIQVPIVSTNVGLAEEILSKKSIIVNDINSATPDTIYAREKVEKHILPKGIHEFEKMFKRINED